MDRSHRVHESWLRARFTSELLHVVDAGLEWEFSAGLLVVSIPWVVGSLVRSKPEVCS